jgi:hypothetical protein
MLALYHVMHYNIHCAHCDITNVGDVTVVVNYSKSPVAAHAWAQPGHATAICTAQLYSCIQLLADDELTALSLTLISV